MGRPHRLLAQPPIAPARSKQVSSWIHWEARQRGTGWVPQRSGGERLSYQPHTSADVGRMLASLGLDDVDELFQTIPTELRAPAGLDLPRPHAEQEVATKLARLTGRNRHLNELTCFLGAGVYDHYVPACVWYLAGRGEFVTSYT